MTEITRVLRIISQLDPAAEAKLYELLPRNNGVTEVLETSTVRTSPSATSLTSIVTGPLVRAGEPNLNGALFEIADLEYGLNSLVGGPLTLNHGDFAVGFMEEATLNESPDLGSHISIVGRVWSKRFGNTWGKVEEAIASGRGALSMECIASQISCMASACGCSISPLEMEDACEHIKERSAPRRQVDPTFFGAALVLPPEVPGWPAATLSY